MDYFAWGLVKPFRGVLIDSEINFKQHFSSDFLDLFMGIGVSFICVCS